MENLEYDFNKICRVCKSESTNMRSVFANEENSHQSPRIDEMLMACTAVLVSSEDGLPSLICPACTLQLNNAYNFKNQCENTDSSLRQYLKMKDSRMVKLEPIQNQCIESDITKELNSSIESEITDNVVNNVSDNSTTVDNEVNTVISHNMKMEFEVEQQPQEESYENSISSDYIQFLENNQLLLTCRTCSKCFTTLDGLKCHKRLHTGNLFKCKECDKQYTRQNHLYRHEMTHGRRKVHVCKICSKTLTRFEHLKRHLITHLKEKPYSCTTCNRGFNRSEHLTNHVKRCKGDRVHICDICNKGFNREDSLEVHKRLHENKMPVLPTLENLDNIDQHYVEIEYDGNTNDSLLPYSDSDSEQDVADCLEPQVDISENTEPVRLTDIAEVANLAPFLTSSNEVYGEMDSQELIDQKNKIEEEFIEHDGNSRFEVKEEEESNSEDSEYFPTKPVAKIKRKRGRPRKNSISKSPGRPRGRPPLQKIKTEPIDEVNNEPEGEFPCPACDKVFTKMSMLDKHEGLKIHPCTICNKKFSRSNHLKRHMLSHLTQKPFSCEVCAKSFNRRDHLKQHMKLHIREQDYECDICKRPFSRADQLAKHKASKHNIGEKVMGEKKYQCSVCLKGFTTEKYRDIHMKGHMGDKKFQCRTCDKTFLSKSHLTEHVKFHNENSKKFLCSECGQRFIRNDYLVIHMRRHRGEKPFKCQYCGKGFPRTTDLTVHERYHTGEKTHLCTICGRGFGRAYNLTVHMRTHTGEKPYQCTYCDAAFAQGNDLKAHVRRHTGERFQCEHCTESFLMGYLLTQHKRTVHGLNVVSNIRRLQPVLKRQPEDPDDPPPITIPLPTPVVPATVFNAQLQAQLAVAQLHQQISRPEGV